MYLLSSKQTKQKSMRWWILFLLLRLCCFLISFLVGFIQISGFSPQFSLNWSLWIVVVYYSTLLRKKNSLLFLFVFFNHPRYATELLTVYNCVAACWCTAHRKQEKALHWILFTSLNSDYIFFSPPFSSPFFHNLSSS